MYKDTLHNESEDNMYFFLDKLEFYHSKLSPKERKRVDNIMGKIYLLNIKRINKQIDPILYKKNLYKLQDELDKVQEPLEEKINGSSITSKLEPLMDNWYTNGVLYVFDNQSTNVASYN